MELIAKFTQTESVTNAKHDRVAPNEALSHFGIKPNTSILSLRLEFPCVL